MDAAEILKLSGSYKVDDLARIFSQMDESQVAQVLTLMPPDEAAKISKTIEAQAEVPASTSS